LIPKCTMGSGFSSLHTPGSSPWRDIVCRQRPSRTRRTISPADFRRLRTPTMAKGMVGLVRRRRTPILTRTMELVILVILVHLWANVLDWC
jgi:hypothetical protein